MCGGGVKGVRLEPPTGKAGFWVVLGRKVLSENRRNARTQKDMILIFDPTGLNLRQDQHPT